MYINDLDSLRIIRALNTRLGPHQCRALPDPLPSTKSAAWAQMFAQQPPETKAYLVLLKRNDKLDVHRDGTVGLSAQLDNGTWTNVGYNHEEAKKPTPLQTLLCWMLGCGPWLINTVPNLPHASCEYCGRPDTKAFDGIFYGVTNPDKVTKHR